MIKLSYTIFGLFPIVTALFSLTSCEKDASLDQKQNQSSNSNSANGWIYDIMQKNYLWTNEMPAYSQTDTTAQPEEFFYSLLSNKDGKHDPSKGLDHYYSSIEKDLSTKSSTENITYGFKSAYRYLEDNPSLIYAGIKYILPGSPAEKAGLKRGDWISHYNGVQLTRSNYIQFHNYTGKMTLVVNQMNRYGFINPREVELEAAINMPENPIFVDTVLLVGNKKIAYLMYNSFISGPNGYEDKTYDNQLKAVFSNFANQQPNEMVLDLRYNGGGVITSAQLLATMLAPQQALDHVFCRLKYNEKTKPNSYEYFLSKQILNEGGANLNLDRLYVITSQETASASELIINGLRPYMDVILVGTQTEGKNVGSNEFSGKDKNHPWILHPITCWVENKDGFSDYADGFIPEYDGVEDDFNSSLGHPEEYMLSQVLSVIQTGSLRPTFRNIEETLQPLPEPRKKIQGLIIR